MAGRVREWSSLGDPAHEPKKLSGGTFLTRMVQNAMRFDLRINRSQLACFQGACTRRPQQVHPQIDPRHYAGLAMAD
jgi:hypothetical protein